MFFQESAIIANKHPELKEEIYRLDEHLYYRRGKLLQVDTTADILEMDVNFLKRLLKLYETRGVVEREEIFLCPEDGEILERNENGLLWCDSCELEYQPDECDKEIAYRVISAPDFYPSFSKGYALLIGINDYHNLRPLRKAAIDAEDLANLLKDAGYPCSNIHLLLNETATKGAINDAFDRLARSVGPEDTVIIFFSGHGAQRLGGFEPGEYLCPVDADWYNLRCTAISTEEFTTALRALNASRVAVLLDACHSGGVGEPKDISSQVKCGLSGDAYNRLAEGIGRIIIASCQPDEVSWELPSMRNGVFTHCLLEALRGAAADPDGIVRVLDLFKYLSKEVPKYVKQQHPLFKGELEDNFPLVIATNIRERK